MRSASLLWCVVALGLACEGAQPEAQPDAVTYHKDIAPLLSEHCNGCHVEGGIGPFAFGSYDEAARLAPAIRAAVENRTMPPWHAGRDCAEYEGDLSLDEAQIQRVVAWVEQGTPKGDPGTAAPLPSPREGGLSRVDAVLRMPAAYTPRTRPDDYRCFLLDWPETEATFVTGFELQPDNPTITHHAIAYLIAPGRSEKYEALDAQDEVPGWTCFGGPGGEQSLDAGWLGTWAPGTLAADFPDGVGIKVEPGSKVVLQMHYNIGNGEGSDQTGIALKLSPSVEREGVIVPFTNAAWALGRMPIPSDQAQVEHSYDDVLGTWLGLVGSPPPPDRKLRVYNANLHLHQLGVRAKTWIKRKDGSEACLLDIPRWDFHWQHAYNFTSYQVVAPGDRVHLSCVWDNTQANQPFEMMDTDGDGEGDELRQPAPTDRNWGEGSSDEMCAASYFVTLD